MGWRPESLPDVRDDLAYVRIRTRLGRQKGVSRSFQMIHFEPFEAEKALILTHDSAVARLGIFSGGTRLSGPAGISEF